MKKSNSFWQKLKLAVIALGVMLVATPITSYAIDFNTRIIELQGKFPEGKYWNHVGGADNPDAYSDVACSCHNTGVCITGSGNCTCNHYMDLVESKHNQSTQCMGFANKLGYDVFGSTTWTRIMTDAVANIKIGDIVRLDKDTHSVFVIARNENVITVGEANYYGKCRISWTRTIDLSTANITYYERANNYDSVIGSVTSPISPAPDNPDNSDTPKEDIPLDFTGWKQTVDGLHYMYVLAGVIQKNQWITVEQEKYYLDENGYRVNGLYEISGQRYFFDVNGILQKKQWVVVDGEDYYIGDEGFALKSQWLYHGNTLVYVTGDGSVAKAEMVKIGKNTYYFNASGNRSKGFKLYEGQYYYCNSKGIIQKKKWVKKGNKKYYMKKSGVRAQSEMVKIGGYRYYFNAKGQMVKNKRVTYNDKVYKADKQGHCKFLYYAE